MAAVRKHVRSDLPAYPKENADGNMSALKFCRVFIARAIIRERRALGLSQQALADLARVQQKTLSRIETAKHTATLATITKIDAALKKAAKRSGRRATKKRA